MARFDNDTTKISKYFGGGGHKNASGFAILFKDYNLNEIFVKKGLIAKDI